jgi:hypothetical protein
MLDKDPQVALMWLEQYEKKKKDKKRTRGV